MHEHHEFLIPTILQLSCISSNMMEAYRMFYFVLPFLEGCTNLSTFILQSQMEFESQVFKDPNEFNDM